MNFLVKSQWGLVWNVEKLKNLDRWNDNVNRMQIVKNTCAKEQILAFKPGWWVDCSYFLYWFCSSVIGIGSPLYMPCEDGERGLTFMLKMVKWP